MPSAEPKLVAKLSRAQNRTGRVGGASGVSLRNEESFFESQNDRAPANQIDLVENTEVKDTGR